MFNILNKLFYRKSPFHNTILAENVLICSDWQEIDTNDLVKVERDRQLISIDLELPFETPFEAKGIKIPSGEIINPEIKLIDNENNEYEFVYYGAGGTETSRYQYNGYLPDDKIYNKVLLRSEFPIRAQRILWTGFNLKDRK